MCYKLRSQFLSFSKLSLFLPIGLKWNDEKCSENNAKYHYGIMQKCVCALNGSDSFQNITLGHRFLGQGDSKSNHQVSQDGSQRCYSNIFENNCVNNTLSPCVKEK